MKKSYLMLLLVAMFALVACDNNDGKPQRSEYDIAIDNLMAQCKNFDAEMLIQGLPGVWEINSLVTYNADWSTIDQPHLVMGKTNAVGIPAEIKYTFTEDGKGLYCVVPVPFPDANPSTTPFNWRYNADNHKLIMTWETGIEIQRTVSGFNSEYIVLDYVDDSTKQNIREILKKKVE